MPAYVRVSVHLFSTAPTWRWPACERASGGSCFCLITTQTYSLFSELSCLCTHLPLPSPWLLEGCCPWCWKFHHTFFARLFLFSGFPGHNPSAQTLDGLQRQYIHFASTKCMPAVGSLAPTGELLSFKTFRKKKSERKKELQVAQHALRSSKN